MPVQPIECKIHVLLQFVFTILVLSSELHAKNKGLILPSMNTCARMVGESVGNDTASSLPQNHQEIQAKLPAFAKLVVEALEVVVQRGVRDGQSTEVLLRLEKAADVDVSMIQRVQDELQNPGSAIGASPADLTARLKIAAALNRIQEIIRAYTHLGVDKDVSTREILQALRGAAVELLDIRNQVARAEKERKKGIQEERARHQAVLREARELLAYLKKGDFRKYQNVQPEDLVSEYRSYSKDVVEAVKKMFIIPRNAQFKGVIVEDLRLSSSKVELANKLQIFQREWFEQVKDLRIFFESVGDWESQKLLETPPYEEGFRYAAENGHAEWVSLLLPYITEEQLSKRENWGRNTLLMLVVAKGYVEVVKLLLPHTTEEQLSWKNGNTETTLMTAVLNDRVEVVRVLLPYLTEEHLNKKDGLNRTALTLAEKYAPGDIVELIKARLRELNP